jgi:hypothetical protein
LSVTHYITEASAQERETCTMEIIGRNPNPDKYSISEVRVAFDTAKQREGKKEWRNVVSAATLLVPSPNRPDRRRRGIGGASAHP